MTNEELLQTLVTMGAKAHAYDQIAHAQALAAKDAEIAALKEKDEAVEAAKKEVKP